jgi:hypothetical protein
MKKMIFLLLTLLIWGAASMNAQVKIGGDGTTGPVVGAVLELDGANGALVLPQFASLSALTTAIPATSALKGALVYCADKLYTCNGSAWVVADAGATYTAGTGIAISNNQISSTVVDTDTQYTGTAPITVDGTYISATDASASAKGVVQVGDHISVSSGTISVPTASAAVAGVSKIGAGLVMSDDVLEFKGNSPIGMPSITTLSVETNTASTWADQSAICTAKGQKWRLPNYLELWQIYEHAGIPRVTSYEQNYPSSTGCGSQSTNRIAIYFGAAPTGVRWACLNSQGPSKSVGVVCINADPI